MEKAIVYTRVSTEEQVREGVSLDAQEARVRAYCTMAGLEVATVIREEGVSAGKPLSTRPGGSELLRAIARGEAVHVIALKLDRLFRDAVDALQTTQAWDNAGVALHLVDLGGQAVNTGSAMGRFFLNVMAGCAELERNLTRERTIAALTYKKANGAVYGPVPFGFDREGDELLPNRCELFTVGAIRRERSAGRSLQGIAGMLNGQGVPTKSGGAWYPSTVKYILSNRLYDGRVDSWTNS